MKRVFERIEAANNPTLMVNERKTDSNLTSFCLMFMPIYSTYTMQYKMQTKIHKSIMWCRDLHLKMICIIR